MEGGEFERDRAVRLQIYRHFVDHQRPPGTAEIASALQLSKTEVQAACQRLARGRVLVLQPGDGAIRMAMPFSAVPTRFRVSASGRTWWANCAWDALGIPAMLEVDATIFTSCPDCDQPIMVPVESGRVLGNELIHFVVPASRWWDDITFT